MGCALIPDDSDEIDNVDQSVRNGLQREREREREKVSCANSKRTSVSLCLVGHAKLSCGLVLTLNYLTHAKVTGWSVSFQLH